VAVSRTPRLVVVADLDYAGSESRLIEVVEALAPMAAHPRVAIQLRAKALEAQRLEELARTVRERLPAHAFLVLNGSAEVAARLGYAGVHWPEASLPDRLPGEPSWHSAAVHSIEALERAERAGVDVAIFGSVFAPGSKEGAAVGLDALRRVCEQARTPVVAIGGVTPERVRECFEAGAAGVAAVSGIVGAADPASALREYLDAIESATREGVRR
jgi:thiamine-phosphate diphosphorylase